MNEIAMLPVTLVHGDYDPRNVLVDVNSDRARICAVDWERAALGSIYFDMAVLADGFERDVLLAMLESYRREYSRFGSTMPCDGETLHYLNAYMLFRIVTWLGRTRERQFRYAKIKHLVSRGEMLTAYGDELRTVRERSVIC